MDEKYYDKMYELYANSYVSLDKTHYSTKKKFCDEKDIDVLQFLLAQHRSITEQMKMTGKYEYMVTFTMKDNSMLSDAIKYLTDVIQKRREALGIVAFRYVIEHPDTNAHIHAYIKTKIPLRKNRFNVYEKKFGFTKVDPVKKGQTLEVENYMAKEGGIITII